MSQIRVEQEGSSIIETGVAVAGAGLGGMAAAIFLRQAGIEVTCVEPDPFPHARVGESLDWSAPWLMKAMGISRDKLVKDGQAIYKRKIRLQPINAPDFDGGPMDWLARWPLKFEITTIHADRAEMDQRLYEQACKLGVNFIWDRVKTVKTDGDRVTALETAKHGTVKAKWFIDASGGSRLFARAFNIPHKDYGKRKVCTWTYFNTTTHYDGTTFYGDALADYLSWVWEIPINANTISVGWVISAEEFEQRRHAGETAGQALREELSRYPRFASLLAEQADTPIRTTSYRCYVNERVCGPNWVMAGEAASLPDPLTGNGVTAAFRHAHDATRYMIPSFQRGSFTPLQMRTYENNVRNMGDLFNYGMEVASYQPIWRRALGAINALQVYTAFGYLINALYNKYQPRNPVPAALFSLVFVFFKVWFVVWTVICRFILAMRGIASRLRTRRTQQLAAD